MEEKITMLHDEVVENVEEIAKMDFRNGVAYAIGGGIIVAGGIVTYKYLVKPMLAKHKAKKEEKSEGNAKSYAVIEREDSEMESDE